jgi:hypothetical protein
MNKFYYVLYIRTLADRVLYFSAKDIFTLCEDLNDAKIFSTSREAEKEASYQDAKYKVLQVRYLGNGIYTI